MRRGSGNSSWWGTFAKSFFGDFLFKGAKQSGETWSAWKVDANRLMQMLKENFSSFANFSGTLSSAVFSPGRIIQGQSVRIDTNITVFPGYAVGSTNRVVVSSVAQDSFTFTAVGGEHFTAGGSTVSFSSRNVGGGRVEFAVDINGRTANALFTAIADLGGKATEAAVWNNLLKNMSAQCQRPPAQ
jgi:hypothetical protein